MHAITLTGFFKTIILLGIVQGLVVSNLLFFSREKRLSSRVLSVLILLMSLASLNLYGEYMNWFGSDLLRLVVCIVPLVIAMAFGPLIYLYVRSSLDPAFTLTKKHRLHFYPVIIDLVPSLMTIFYIAAVIFKWIRPNPAPVGLFIDTYNIYADIPRWISISCYVWVSARYLSSLTMEGMANTGQKSEFRWLRQFIRVFIIFQCIWLVYLVPYIIPRYNQPLLDAVGWYPVFIPLAILIYWLGLKGYIFSQQRGGPGKKPPASPTPTEAIIQSTMELLRQAMEADKLYLQPNLTAPLLAEKINIPQKTISAVLNQHMHKSFNEFVNEYRIAAFKEKVGEPGLDHLTIAGIALECGFHSQATFQRTFRELTGMSPSEYRKAAGKTT